MCKVASNHRGPNCVLVVLGSVQLTSPDFSHVASSVALGAARRFRALGVPVLLTNRDMKQAPKAKEAIRALALVAPWGTGLVGLVGSRLMEQSKRPGRLYWHMYSYLYMVHVFSLHTASTGARPGCVLYC